ncbi:scarecrow-like protein 33 [Brachypodium distachyon]|nr:scarecrow-like protein 33 [Brachypodium distachyon]|eukprot:XP_003575609.4 scarecrow-like protein 33 [Brachypodium distachyon]
MSLTYISHMLMEDDINDKLSYKYTDHLKLLRAEQPFAQILSAAANTSLGAQDCSAPDAFVSALMPNQDNNKDSIDCELLSSEVQDPTFLNGTDLVKSNSTQFPGENNSSTSMAFFKGMEEASMLLPKHNGMSDRRGHKNRFGVDGETAASMGRSSKQIAVLVHTDSEEDTALQMLDRLILNGYNKHPSEMQDVLITLDKENKAAQKSIHRRGRRRATQPVLTDLETLLIRCAEAVSRNDRGGASELLERIRRYSSPRGDASQRLAHYFAQGLEARLADTGSQLYRSLIGKHLCTVELVQAYYLHMATCCFINVAGLFSNCTIYNAVAGRRKLHIVHYGMITGYKWPLLIQRLADREGGPPEVRITAINNPQPGFRPAEPIEEAGHRLRNCAMKFGVSFKFHAIAAKPEVVHAEDLHIDPDEVLVVNSLFQFRTLIDECLTFDRVSPRDMVLNTIRKMKPSVFIHAVVNGSYSAAFFMTRFRQALYNFTALFDVMDTTIPRDNNSRLVVERDIFAWSAINMIACEGTDRVERPHHYREWQARNQRAGLRQLPLDPDIFVMLKDELKNKYHKHFMIDEDHQWLLQGWKGRVLYALSTWVADHASSSNVT